MPRKIAAARFVLSEHASSPIDIKGEPHYNAPPIQFNYPTNLTVEFSATNGVLTAFVAEADQGTASIGINGKIYFLKQFHVHTPSEHTINGERFTMEWHFVHQTTEGEYAVIGLFMHHESDVATTAPYSSLIEAVDSGVASCVLSPRALITKCLEGWHYQGTLTTVPFDPVYWVVVKESVMVGEDDLRRLTKAFSQSSSN
ncbi:MAG: carbonic anhydrase [Candidatus Dependentiae bacterium]|nr:carbonic anhydrase [Candidatus Dependentiae bacterium]